MNHPKLSLVCAVCAMTSGPTVYADLIAYEGFDYTDVGGDLRGKDGGTGFRRTWFPTLGKRADLIDISDGSLTFPGLKSEANLVSTPVPPDCEAAARGLDTRITRDSTTTKYLSALVRPEGTLGQGSATVVGSFAGGGEIGDVDLIYVPEPVSALLLAMGVVIVLAHLRVTGSTRISDCRWMVKALAFGIVVVCSHGASATLLYYESFTESSLPTPLLGANPDSGGVWTRDTNFAPPIDDQITVGSIDPTGTLAHSPSGGSLKLNIGNRGRGTSPLSGGGVGSDNTTVYASMLINISGSRRGFFTGVEMWNGPQAATSNPNRAVRVGWTGGLYAVQTNTGRGRIRLDEGLNFVVLQFNYVAGQDTVDVFVNPTLEDLTSSNPDGQLARGNFSFDRIGIGNFNSMAEGFVDELRIGTTLADVAVVPEPLQAGDADQDFDFDQLDLVQVQIAAKYLSGQSATWGEGDWNGAPGGSPGNPPVGDGMFNQLDIVAAQQAGIYLAGPYAALGPNGQANDGQTSIIYNAGSGELAVDTPAGTELTSINIDSATGIFTGDAAENLGGSFDNDADDNIFKATFGSSFGTLSFGNVAQSGLTENFLLDDLTVVGSLQGGGALGDVDLIYVPEPTSLVLLLLAAFALLARPRVLDVG